jgi:hypothetical protein
MPCDPRLHLEGVHLLDSNQPGVKPGELVIHSNFSNRMALC